MDIVKFHLVRFLVPRATTLHAGGLQYARYDRTQERFYYYDNLLSTRLIEVPSCGREIISLQGRFLIRIINSKTSSVQ